MRAGISGTAGALVASLAVATAARAEAMPPDKGDVAWMMTATLLVLLMILPGLALFYGGLVRAKNMLSVLMQCTTITALVMVIWVVYGYSFTFGGGTGAVWGGTGKLFLSGITPESRIATFTEGVELPELVFVAFQMTFACITPALITGAFAERMRFPAVLVFVGLWVTVVYFPVAHMVWDANGLLYRLGAIDFAGGTVVHVNAGIAALCAAVMVGPRAGFGRDNMAPHSMTLTLVGAALLWVGWFGFNAGSNLEANSGAALAMLNTFVATAAAILAWAAIEAVLRGKASVLGAASGMVAGLVAVTPACGTVGPMGAMALGAVSSGICYVFVSTVKRRFGYDDSLDVFGIHGIGGIVGALGTGLLSGVATGGVRAGYSALAQTRVQLQAVALTVLWCTMGTVALLWLVRATIGLRVTPEAERQGLDLAAHGESAYHR